MLSDESVEDLMLDNLNIIQKKEGFRFGTDAVILSLFVKINGNKKVLDLGTGTGIIPILLSYKNKKSVFTGLELQTEIADMALRSVKMNKIEDRINIVCGDIKNVPNLFEKASFDIVVSNPPYKKAGTGIKNINKSNALARHEIACNLEDVIKAAADMLVPGGSFYMINRPERLADTFCEMRKYRLEPKLIRFVHTDINKKPILFLAHACLYGGSNLKVDEPVLINETVTCKMLKNKQSL